ncbi:PP2C family protein-serine/threonine phosphatase [Streptomyces sp. NPDC093586]|uniref:PP2C family protein-serine/threonine phosphatase n=1 Tax=Streptomyces sp. NPDC093586 TaxID=3366042 RepID=UPI00380B7F56
MDGGDLELGELLAAAEAAPPGGSVDVVARNLQKRFGAERVSFLFVDLIGQRLVRLPATVDGGLPARTEPIDLQGSVYDSVLRSQRRRVEPDGQGGQRVITPVTNRGDCIGVLEVILQHADDTVLRQVGEAAHALAYIVVTDRRFTDLYHVGQRTTTTSLAAEIQHQLLPSAACCEADRFTLAAGLVPADDIGGDTYDYSLDGETLHLSITDAMGHDTDSALLATLLVGALRRARRGGCDALRQARHAHEALLAHGRGLATGQLFCIDLETGVAELVNAGHPWPLRVRGTTVEEVGLAVNLPFGVASPIPYALQELRLRPGDRLVLLTDGMQDRGAAAAGLSTLLRDTRALHPRETVRALTAAVRDACHGDLEDDATVMVLDWHGTRPAGPPMT